MSDTEFEGGGDGHGHGEGIFFGKISPTQPYSLRVTYDIRRACFESPVLRLLRAAVYKDDFFFNGWHFACNAGKAPKASEGPFL